MPPWELVKQPTVWRDWALTIMAAESDAMSPSAPSEAAPKKGRHVH